MIPESDAELLEALWEAWCDHRVIELPAGAWTGLTADRAIVISNELYRRLDPTPSGAWKLGGFDPEGLRRAGLTAPLVAPVPSPGLSVGASEVASSIASLVQPRLEAEVGIGICEAGLRLVPCIEIADSRLPGWTVPMWAGLADFGLQGAMVFGPDFDPIDDIRVTVRHDGRQVGSGSLPWAEAVRRLPLVTSRPDAAARYVATGAITPLFDARPGRWEFEFEGLTTLALTFS